MCKRVCYEGSCLTFLLLPVFPAVARAEAAVEQRAQDELLGTVELSLGLWDHALGVDFPDGRGALTDKSVTSSLAVVPGIEWQMGRTVYLGGELVLLWVDDPYWALRDRRMLTGLNVRARLSFPVVEKVTADLIVCTGPAVWNSDPRDGTFFGWSRRIGLGGAYEFTPGLWSYGHVSYYHVNAYQASDVFSTSPIRRPQLLDLSTVLFSVGVRGGK